MGARTQGTGASMDTGPALSIIAACVRVPVATVAVVILGRVLLLDGAPGGRAVHRLTSSAAPDRRAGRGSDGSPPGPVVVC